MADVSVLISLFKPLLELIISHGVGEFRLILNKKKELEELEGKISTLRDVLLDADSRQASDPLAAGLIVRLRAVFYKADDLFDMILAKQVSMSTLKPSSFKYPNYAIAKRAKDIKKFLNFTINEDNKLLSLLSFLSNQEQAASKNNVVAKELNPVPSNGMVGQVFVKEREEVEKMLLGRRKESGFAVVAVIGIGGSGKTTLAEAVYNHEKCQQRFEVFLWVCANKFSKLKQVLKQLIDQFSEKSKPKDMASISNLRLQSLFIENIKEKSVLLVVDGVCDEEPQNWYAFSRLLGSVKGGSMVLATTRSVRVAESLNATKPYYMLPGVSDQSALLLFKKVFKEGNNLVIGRGIKKKGKKIVEKCANNTLAIVTIVSSLRHKKEEKWFPLVNDELSTAFPDEYKKIMHELKINYDVLPPQVKRCFAYCSLFPKDYEFDKDRLTRLWIAQGFVKEAGSQSLEDTAEEYLLRLVEICFLKDTETRVNGVIRHTYKMHHLALGLAKEVAESECILVDQIPDGSWNVKTLFHMSINCSSESLESLVKHVKSFSHLRTFLWLNKFTMETTALTKLLMNSFESIRALDLSHLKIKEIPPSVGKLIHLRLFDLSGNFITMLPPSICGLSLLQYLILQGCLMLETLPSDLGKLVSLRHLELEGCHNLSGMPPGLADLKSLNTVERLVVDSHRGRLISSLKHLDDLSESLSIELPVPRRENATADAARLCLSTKSRLHPLTIKCSLVILTLESCGKCVEFPPLSHLLSLKELYIRNMSSVKTIEDYKLCKPDSFFPKLETLEIRNAPNLESWWLHAPDPRPSFRCVSKVNIHDCERLKSPMPLFPLVEDLKLGRVHGELIRKFFKDNMRLRILRILRIRGPNKEFHLVKGVRHLTSLEQITLTNCKELHLSWRELLGLGRLQILTLSSVEKVTDNGSTMAQTQPSSLRELKIQSCSAKWLDGVPWKSLTSLQHVHLSRIDHLKALPEGIKHLKVLKQLKLIACKSVVSFPNWMKHLTSISYLDIRESSEELKNSCEKKRGKDWPLIQHIKKIDR